MTTAAPHPALLDVVRAIDLRQAPAAERWLVDALWAEEGVGVIGGAPKSLKSWIALDLAVAVASGTACLDRFPVRRPGPALVYLAEDRLDAEWAQDVGRRLHMLQCHLAHTRDVA